MAEIISFDGHRKRMCAKRALPQSAENRKPNQHDVSRIVGNYYSGMSPTQAARAEKIGLNEFGRLLRENSRPVVPLPKRRLDYRLIGRAA